MAVTSRARDAHVFVQKAAGNKTLSTHVQINALVGRADTASVDMPVPSDPRCMVTPAVRTHYASQGHAWLQPSAPQVHLPRRRVTARSLQISAPIVF